MPEPRGAGLVALQEPVQEGRGRARGPARASSGRCPGVVDLRSANVNASIDERGRRPIKIDDVLVVVLRVVDHENRPARTGGRERRPVLSYRSLMAIQYRPRPDRDARLAAIRELISHILVLQGGSLVDFYKRKAIDRLLWKITEVDGKYRTRFRSEGALSIDRRENRRLRAAGQRLLRHEHVFTRSWLLDELLERPTEVGKILDLAIGCVVTEAEHQRLTAVRYAEGWERYQAAGVRVFDMSTDPPSVIPELRHSSSIHAPPPAPVAPPRPPGPPAPAASPSPRSIAPATEPCHMPLMAAYPFAVEHGLRAEVEAIRNMPIVWDRPYTSSVRRGYVIELFERHGIFDEFKAEHWPFGSTAKGERRCEWYQRLKEEFESKPHSPDPA